MIGRKEYESILLFYKKPIPKSLKTLKNKAEYILANKLCRCIKKVKKRKRTEKQAIGICRRSVMHTKKLDFYKFKCKKTPRFTSTRKTKHKLFKRR